MVQGSQSSAGVVISSVEIAEEEKKADLDRSEEASQVDASRLEVGKTQRKLCASNEFEDEEKRDL